MQIPIALPYWLQVVVIFVPSVSAFFAALALWLNFYQSKRTNQQARATLVANFLTSFADDRDMQEIFYEIEYGNFQFNDEFHHSDLERKLDRLLVHFSTLAQAWKAGLLQDGDVIPVQYFVRRLMRDEEVLKYLVFLDNWRDHADLGEHPYDALRAMSRVLGA